MVFPLRGLSEASLTSIEDLLEAMTSGDHDAYIVDFRVTYAILLALARSLDLLDRQVWWTTQSQSSMSSAMSVLSVHEFKIRGKGKKKRLKSEGKKRGRDQFVNEGGIGATKDRRKGEGKKGERDQAVDEGGVGTTKDRRKGEGKKGGRDQPVDEGGVGASKDSRKSEGKKGGRDQPVDEGETTKRKRNIETDGVVGKELKDRIEKRKAEEKEDMIVEKLLIVEFSPDGRPIAPGSGRRPPMSIATMDDYNRVFDQVLLLEKRFGLLESSPGLDLLKSMHKEAVLSDPKAVLQVSARLEHIERTIGEMMQLLKLIAGASEQQHFQSGQKGHEGGMNAKQHVGADARSRRGEKSGHVGIDVLSSGEVASSYGPKAGKDVAVSGGLDKNSTTAKKGQAGTDMATAFKSVLDVDAQSSKNVDSKGEKISTASLSSKEETRAVSNIVKFEKEHVRTDEMASEIEKNSVENLKSIFSPLDYELLEDTKSITDHSAESSDEKDPKSVIEYMELKKLVEKARNELPQICIPTVNKVLGAAGNVISGVAVLEAKIKFIKKCADQIETVENKIADSVSILEDFNDQHNLWLTCNQEEITEMEETLKEAIDKMNVVLANRGSSEEGVKELSYKFSSLQMNIDEFSEILSAFRDTQKAYKTDLTEISRFLQELQRTKVGREEVETALESKATVKMVNGKISKIYYEAVEGEIQKAISDSYDRFGSQEMTWQKLIDDLEKDLSEKIPKGYIEGFEADYANKYDQINDRADFMFEVLGERLESHDTKIQKRIYDCLCCGKEPYKEEINESTRDRAGLLIKKRKTDLIKEINTDGDGDPKICYPKEPVSHLLHPRSKICGAYCGGQSLKPEYTGDVKKVSEALKVIPRSVSVPIEELCHPCNWQPIQKAARQVKKLAAAEEEVVRALESEITLEEMEAESLEAVAASVESLELFQKYSKYWKFHSTPLSGSKHIAASSKLFAASSKLLAASPKLLSASSKLIAVNPKPIAASSKRTLAGSKLNLATNPIASKQIMVLRQQ